MDHGFEVFLPLVQTKRAFQPLLSGYFLVDIAVLGAPDCKALSDEHTQYEAFLSALPPFDIAAPPPRGRLRMPAFDADDPPAWRWLGEAFFPGSVLSLDGQWIECNVRRLGGPLGIEPSDSVPIMMGCRGR